MKLYEMISPETASKEGYYDPSEDKANKFNMDDTRKNRLTLKKLNRLKKMRAMKKLEQLVRQDLLGVMYGGETETGSPAGGGGGFF